MGSSSFLRALAKDKEDKGVDERGARTSSSNEPLHYRNPANESKAGVSSASSVRSQEQNLGLVRNTGLVTQTKEALPKIKTALFGGNKSEVPNTNLFRNLTVEKNERGFTDEINDYLQKNREKRAAVIAEYQEAQQKAESQGLNGLEALWAAGASQREEQKNQKSSSFMAGLLNSTGGNAAKIAAKIAQKTGNEDVANYWNKQTDWLEELQNANKGYGTAGAIAGEFAKAGAGYATIGKAAEKAAQKAAEKGLAVAGKKMAVSTASDTAQKIAAGLTWGGREAKIAKTAAGLLGQQAADTVVNTPITIAAGLAEGKDKKEILKDIGKQEATDAAFNVGLEALGAGAKAAGKKVKERSKKGPIAGIDFEKIGYENAPVDENLIAFKQGVDDGSVGKWEVYKLKEPTERAVKEISEKTGVDISGYGVNIKPNELTHIEKRHGVHGEADKSMADLTDIGKIQYILDNYDNVELSDNVSNAYKNSDGTAAKIVVFDKRINGTYYVIEAVPDNKRKNLQIISAYKSKKKEGYQVSDAKLPPTNGRTVLELPSTDNLTGKTENVNKGTDFVAEDAAEGAVNTAREVDSSVNEGKFDSNFQIDYMPDIKEEGAKNAAHAKKVDEITNVMMDDSSSAAKKMEKEKRDALMEEYVLLNDDDYLKTELQKIYDSGGGMKETRAFYKQVDNRIDEIRSTLIEQERLLTVQDISRDTADNLYHLFGFSSGLKRKELYNAMEQLTGKIQDETITQKDINDLFQILYSSKRDIPKLDSYKLKNRLRKIKLRVDPSVAYDAGIDIYKWKRNPACFSKIERSSRNGNTESVYMELAKDFPVFFPKNIDNPAAQVSQIKKVAEQVQSADFVPSEADYKKNFLYTLKQMRDSLDIKVDFDGKFEDALEDYMKIRDSLTGKIDFTKVTAQDVIGWHDEIYRLEQATAEGRNLLPKSQRNVLEEMLDGRITEEQAKEKLGSAYVSVKAIYEKEKPIQELRNQIEEYNIFKNKQRKNKVAEIVGGVHLGEGGWKDKRLALAYARETQERNIYDIAPAGVAKRIKEGIFDPVHEHERQKQLFLHDCYSKLRSTGISTKKNIDLHLPGTNEQKVSESQVLHWLGEKEYELQNMKNRGQDNILTEIDTGNPAIAEKQSEMTEAQWDKFVDKILSLQKEYTELSNQIAGVRSKLTEEQLARIENAQKTWRMISDQTHGLQNDAVVQAGYEPIGYIENYYPHMEFYEPTSAFGKLAQKLGFDFHSDELPMEISGLTEEFRPNKRWSGHILERKGTATDYDAFRVFEKYLESAADIIFHTEDIQTLRAYEEYLRYNASDEGIKNAIQAIRNDKALSWDDKQKMIQKKYKEGESRNRLQNYVNNITEYTNILAGKKHSSDRDFEKNVAGRKFYKIADELENRVSKNMVAGNISSAITNFIPMTQALGSMKTSSSIRGMKEALSYMGQGEMDVLTRKSTFLATRQEPEKLYKNWIDRLNDAGNKLVNPLKLMDAVDTFSTQAVWRGKYYDNLAKGMTEDVAIKNADDYARGLFAGRSKGSMPTIFNVKKPTAKPFLMFQLEANNQFSHYLKDIPREEQKNAVNICKRWFSAAIGAYIFNDIYEAVIGRRPALDPFGAANEAIGDATGEKLRNLVDIFGDAIGDVAEGIQNGGGFDIQMPELTEKTENKSTNQMLSNLAENVGGQIPFVGGFLFDGGRIPISGAIPGSTQIRNAIGMKADGDYDTKTALSKVSTELQKPLWYLLMPTAGSQMKKTVGGLQTMLEGGSYNQTSNGERLQFTVDQENPKDWMQSLLFGKYATDSGKIYMNDFSTGMGASQTATYKALVADGVKNTKAAEVITQIRSFEDNKDKRSVIRNSGLTANQQATLYRDFVLNDDSKDAEILVHFAKSKEKGEVARCLMQMADYDSTSTKCAILKNAELPDASKEWIYLHKISSSDKDEERISNMKNAGLDIDDFLKIKNKIKSMSDSGLKSRNKKVYLEQWMKGQGYNAKQYDVAVDCFF